VEEICYVTFGFADHSIDPAFIGLLIAFKLNESINRIRNCGACGSALNNMSSWLCPGMLAHADPGVRVEMITEQQH
jgi:hypothetical protein